MKKCYIFACHVGVLLVNSLACASVSASGDLVLKPATDESIVFRGALSLLIGGVLLAVACYGLVWWKKRSKPEIASGNEHIPIVKASRRITQKTTLITVAWRGKVYLLAENQASVMVVDNARIDDSAKAADGGRVMDSAQVGASSP